MTYLNKYYKEFTGLLDNSNINDLVENWESVVGKIEDKDEFIKTASILSKEEIIKANYSLVIFGKTCSNYKFFLLSNRDNSSFNGKTFVVKTYKKDFFNDGINLGKPIYYEWCRNHKFMSPPQKTGIYFLFNEGVLVYIGFSRNVRNRLKSHYRDKYKPFDAIIWITNKNLSIDEWLKVERDQIRFWSPSLNINYVG